MRRPDRVFDAVGLAWLVGVGLWINLHVVSAWFQGPFGRSHHFWLLLLVAIVVQRAASGREGHRTGLVVYGLHAAACLIPPLYLLAYIPTPLLMAWGHHLRKR